MPDLSTNSIAHASRQLEICHRPCRLAGALILLFCQALLLRPLLAAYPEVEFRAETLEYERASLYWVKLRLESDGRFNMASERVELEGADRSFAAIALSGAIDGVSIKDEESSLQGRLEYGGVKAEFEVHNNPDEFIATLGTDGLEIEKLKQMTDLPAAMNWVSRGHVNAVVSYRAGAGRSPEISLDMNWIDLAKEGVAVGPWLEMDTATEKFKQDSQYGTARWANEMLTRKYRAPFIVPENV